MCESMLFEEKLWQKLPDEKQIGNGNQVFATTSFLVLVMLAFPSPHSASNPLINFIGFEAFS